MIITIHDVEGTDVPRYLQIYDLPVDPDPLSERNIVTIEDHLEICRRSHDKCSNQGGASDPTQAQAPTRLLSIGGPEIRVVIPREMARSQDHFQYATLSYCWGNPPPLKTERRNINDRKTSISWDSLPEVFQDAIKAAKCLRINYLWIDQDDEDDWRRESARMADIYRNAVLTIAAASSDSAQIGFHYIRSNPYIWPQIPMPSSQLGILR